MKDAWDAVVQLVRSYPYGVAGPVLLIGVQLVEDFNGPAILALLFGITGVVAVLIHFVSSSVPWFSKRKSYRSAVLYQIVPVMVAWIGVIFVRAGLMWILGKPL